LTNSSFDIRWFIIFFKILILTYMHDLISNAKHFKMINGSILLFEILRWESKGVLRRNELKDPKFASLLIPLCTYVSFTFACLFYVCFTSYPSLYVSFLFVSFFHFYYCISLSLSFFRFAINSAAVFRHNQGDQIGRIFASWASVYLVCFWKLRKYPIFLAPSVQWESSGANP
jgi:hypothetical protein